MAGHQFQLAFNKSSSCIQGIASWKGSSIIGFNGPLRHPDNERLRRLYFFTNIGLARQKRVNDYLSSAFFWQLQVFGTSMYLSG